MAQGTSGHTKQRRRNGVVVTGQVAVAAAVIAGLVLGSIPVEAPWAHDLEGHAGADQVSVAPLHCPDATPDGPPCPDGCTCLCCPGHTRLLLGHHLTSLHSPLLAGQDTPELVDDLFPRDVVRRVFHPPRRG